MNTPPITLEKTQSVEPASINWLKKKHLIFFSGQKKDDIFFFVVHCYFLEKVWREQSSPVKWYMPMDGTITFSWRFLEVNRNIEKAINVTDSGDDFKYFIYVNAPTTLYNCNESSKNLSHKSNFNQTSKNVHSSITFRKQNGRAVRNHRKRSPTHANVNACSENR